MSFFVGSKAQLTYKLNHHSLFDKGPCPVSFTLERQQNLVVLSLALDLDFCLQVLALMVLAVWPWAICFTSLCICLLKQKLGNNNCYWAPMNMYPLLVRTRNGQLSPSALQSGARGGQSHPTGCSGIVCANGSAWLRASTL